jgi:hypothetical protein
VKINKSKAPEDIQESQADEQESKAPEDTQDEQESKTPEDIHVSELVEFMNNNIKQTPKRNMETKTYFYDGSIQIIPKIANDTITQHETDILNYESKINLFKSSTNKHSSEKVKEYENEVNLLKYKINILSPVIHPQFMNF